MVDKLSKALEGLKNIQFSSPIEDTNISKKKMFFCVLAADVMVSLKVVNTQNLPVVIENMINLCDDKDSDVRMVADESLNRIIMSLSESNMLKVQVELHKIIKKNGPARCLRAALARFGQLSCYIRPNKGKAHVQMLIPSLIEISKRPEESIHETLASSFENIFKVLGVFIQDNTLKSLIKAFLHNLSSNNPVIRRCSASCIITVVQYCRKPHVFNSYVLNSLLDCVVPICEDNSSDLVLGILGCLRLLLPNLTCVKNDVGISGSFGLRKRQDECVLSVDRLIQTYELCLHYTNSKDHNVVAAALETLNQVLQNPPNQLELVFLSPAGFSRSYIHSARENKLWSRSGSEMSVAWSLPPMDESMLLDDNDISSQFSTLSAEEQSPVYKVKEKSLLEDDSKLIESPFKDKFSGKSMGSQSTIDVDSDAESISTSDINASTNFLMRIETEDKDEVFWECSRSNSQDELFSPVESEGTCSTVNVIDIGNFTDPAVPLIYCARHLAISFLLEGDPNCLKNDRSVRVSIKSLALSCISAIIKLYPVVMKMSLGKNQNECVQELSDILLYSDHCDPQIRGCVNFLVGSFINSALLESKGFSSVWLSDDNSKLKCSRLIDIILKGLKDESSVCTRQALTAVNLCINNALCSVYNSQFLHLLECLPGLKNNSYWLVKVKLVEVLSDLPFICISDLLNSNTFEEEVIDAVFLPLLGDEDARVRQAAAEALVRAVPLFYNGKTILLDYSKPFTSHLNKWLKMKKEYTNNISPCPPFSYVFEHSEGIDFDANVEITLSKIINKLSHSLLVPENKYFLFGYLEALKLLSQKYPTTVYVKGWNCSKCEKEKSDRKDYLNSNLINTVLSILMTSPLILDLSAFSNGTILLGNLFAGLCISNLKKGYQVPNAPIAGESVVLWDVFTNAQFSELSEEILTHILKVLNVYSRLVEEVTLSTVSDFSTANAFLPLLSPIKKQEKKTEEKLDEKKTKNYNYYKQSTHYTKLQQLLKNAYTNYKVSLDRSVGNKFLDLLESNLYALSILLEVATVEETGRCAEEILSYLQAVFSLRSSAAVTCVIQLLKSLFGTNLASNWEERKLSSLNFQGINLFDSIFHLPSEFLSEKIRLKTNLNSLECENLSGLSRRSERKIVIKNTDKNSLATYIRLFEPMVVKSLQLYTITGDVQLQLNVLKLLNQLVQLRVNYRLLDEKQVFVGFVLTQFELIEHGQIPGVEQLLPHIFKFLVLLSNQKQHSKSIISIPKIMQLCDGLMASDQSIQTHCIPALVPLVEDIFLSKTLVSSVEEKELETQREVLLSMLLRLVEFPQVMDMLTLVLNESKTFEEKERWKRWSRQVIDTVLPLACQDRLRIETVEGQNSFVKLMSSVSVNVLRPIDPLLKALFVEPNDYNCCTSLNRWLSKVTVLLETVLFVKEGALLNRLEEISPNINLATFIPSGSLCSPDPFNVKSFFQIYESSETAARFIFKVISVTGSKILECTSSSKHFQQKLSMFFVCVYYILKSGVFHKITNALQNLLSKEQDSLTAVCSIFEKMQHFCPMITSQFFYFLALLNYCEQNCWKDVLGKPTTLSGKLVQSCGVVALSDYLCDNLSDSETLHYLISNNIEEVISLSHEIPIKELLLTINRKKADWSSFVEAISCKNFQQHQPSFVEKLLRLLEISDNCHSGAVLCLLINKFLGSSRLALSLLAGSIACRQVEFLLTLPKEKVFQQINAQQFHTLVNFFKDDRYLKRHLTLWGLLNKLSINIFDKGLSEINQIDFIETEELKDIQLNEDWYFNQVKQRCCQKNSFGSEASSLLSKLNYDKIIEIMTSPNFNIKIFKHCTNIKETFGNTCESQDSQEISVFETPLYKASKFCILKLINDLKEKVINIRKELEDNGTYSKVVERLLLEKDFCQMLWEVSVCINILLDTFYRENTDLDPSDLEGVTIFAILCLEVIHSDIQAQQINNKSILFPKSLENCFQCCSAVVRSKRVGSFLSETSNRELLNHLIKIIYFIVSHVMPSHCLIRISKNKVSVISDEFTQLEFLLNFVSKQQNEDLLPNYLFSCIRNLVINLCQVPYLCLKILKVPEPNDLQDIEVLEDFISRFSVIGWCSRQQFEEIWVALLSVLGFNTQEDIPVEENGFIVQASAVAVEGITTLLKHTMVDAGSKKLIRHGRDSLSMKNIYEKLPLLKSVYKYNSFSDRTYHFLDNLEVSPVDEEYRIGQLSVEYLWTAVKQISSQVDVYEKHTQEINESGLDLPSCIYLLTELYNQWIYQPNPDIKIISSSLKSCIIISDLFTDIAQFQWLLNFCFRVEKIVTNDDSIILPLIILGCCKAGAIILPNNEVCEQVKKIMLKSSNTPCRLAATQGLLYLLQSYIVSYAVNHTALPPVGSAFQTDEANFVANVVDTFLPVALEFIQQFKQQTEFVSEEYNSCHWSLIFYLLQHYQSSLGELKDEFLNFITTTLCSKTCSSRTMNLLIRGTERLLLTTVVEENFRDQLSKVCLDLISQNSIYTSQCGLQLLSILSFLDKRVKDIRQSVIGLEDPEKVMRDMEKINVLFEKLKRSHPKEAEVVGNVISYVLMDFTASDVLTKVIQEFLSSHQPHQKIVAGLLFKVFERAELSLLEDWVVFSLSSFIQGLPIAMSIWTLNCFFVSASCENWLKSLFPLVQSRFRMAEAEDKKLLCISSARFYKQLKQESQRKSFLQTFEKAATINDVFLHLLKCFR